MILRLYYLFFLIIFFLLNLINGIGFLEIYYLGKWILIFIIFGKI